MDNLAVTPRRRHRPLIQRALPPTLMCATLALTTLAVASPASADPDAGLQVQAQSSIQVAPDQATIRARLWEETPAFDPTAKPQRQQQQEARQQARNTLEQRAAELLDTLGDDLPDKAVNAGSLRVFPRRERVSNRDNSEESHKTLTRTRVERPITVELNDLDRLEKVLDALMAANVNRLDGVRLDLKDRQAATDDALAQALEKARHKAGLMAETLDVELGRVQRIEETRSPGFTPRMMSVRADAQRQSTSSTREADYRPGTIDINAGVNVEWRLKAAPDD